MRTHYAKPILILIDESAFSAGETFAGLMQDNARAKCFGVQTKGGGGSPQSGKADLKALGIQNYKLSFCHLLRRQSHGNALTPLENQGVRPDFPYQTQPSDLAPDSSNSLAGFKSCAKAINEALRQMLKEAQP